MTGRSARLYSSEAPSMDWRHEAACKTEDPELFFPAGKSGPALRQLTRAKAVCAECPIASSCLEWALATGQDFGVWGGTSEDERRAIKRRQYRKSSTGQKVDKSWQTAKS